MTMTQDVQALARDYARDTAALVFGDEQEYEDMYAWLEGVLDVKRTYDSDGDLDSVELLVGAGGPNVWLTFDGRGVTAKVAWYSEPAYAYEPCEGLSQQVLETFDYWSISK
jgi:hypothetical protein